MKVLNISETQLDSDFLISIAGCTQLKELRIREIATENLNFVKDMSQLEVLSASECGITNIDGLKGKGELLYLYLGNNQITSMAVFDGMDQQTNRYFDLRNNAITKCQLPAKLYVLLLEGNPKELVATIPDDANIGYLVLDYDPILLNSNACSVALKKGSEVTKLIVLDVLEDQKLNLKDSLGKSPIISTTERLEECYKESGGDLYTFWNWNF